MRSNTPLFRFYLKRPAPKFGPS